MHGVPAFKGAATQRGYGIGGIFKGLTRTLVLVVKTGFLNLGKQVLESGVQVLLDVKQK